MISMVDLTDQFVEDYEKLRDEHERLKRELTSPSSPVPVESAVQAAQELLDCRRRVAELERELAETKQRSGAMESDRQKEVAKLRQEADEARRAGQFANSETTRLRHDLDLAQQEIQKLRQSLAEMPKQAIPAAPPSVSQAPVPGPHDVSDAAPLRDEIALLKKKLVAKDNEIDRLKNQILDYQRDLL